MIAPAQSLGGDPGPAHHAVLVLGALLVALLAPLLLVLLTRCSGAVRRDQAPWQVKQR